MPTFNAYCSVPAFWSSRVEVTGWAPVSCEYALRAWVLRAVALGTYGAVPAIWFRDGEVTFGKYDSQAPGVDVPSESEILAAVNTLQNYHFTGDEVSFASVEIYPDVFAVQIYPTNFTEPAPTAEELGAYTLALNGFIWSLILDGFVLPDSGVRCDFETFLWNPDYLPPLPELNPCICLVGKDDYDWTEATAEYVTSDLTTLWTAATPSA